MPTFFLETLRIGPKNQLAGSDSLYDAFHKIRNNFAILANANFAGTLSAGNGIGLNTNPISGVVTITNTGVVGVIAGNGISVTGNTGNITISATGGVGSVTSVGVLSSSLSVTSSPITSSGNIIIEMPSYGVSGNYTLPTLTVDNFGRITAIASGGSGGNISANNITANNTVTIGTTQIGWASIVTTSTANATIATIPVANYTGFKFFVKGHDTVGGNRYIATIDVLTDGSNLEIDEYGGMSLSKDTGDVFVELSSGNILLRTAPSSANSTTWTTQYTLI